MVSACQTPYPSNYAGSSDRYSASVRRKVRAGGKQIGNTCRAGLGIEARARAFFR